MERAQSLYDVTEFMVGYPNGILQRTLAGLFNPVCWDLFLLTN